MAINGIQGGFNYRGVNAPNPPNVWLFQRAPTVFDGTDYLIGDLWQYQINSGTITNPNYTTSKIFHLVQQSLGINYWVEITGVGTATTINYQYFTTPGTFIYTPTPGSFQVVVECIGGGGGQQGVGASYASPSAGAGGGGYCRRSFNIKDIGASQIIVVGVGGAGGVNPGDGGQKGGATSFGSFMNALGGDGYAFSDPNRSFGGTASGGDINITGGGAGIYLSIIPIPAFVSDGGGNSGGGWGIGGREVANFSGSPAAFNVQIPPTGYGAGTGASIYTGSGPNIPGIAGTDGIIVVTEYIHL